MSTDPRIDRYIRSAPDFAQPILERLRQLFHRACPEIEETIKWSSPFFEYKGIVGNMTAFQKHVSYGFWKAGLLADPEGILEQVGNTQMAVLKATSLEDLPGDEVLLAYIREAVDLNERGIKVPRAKSARHAEALEIPEDLQAALGDNEDARKTFDNFSYSQRKEYVEWITDAKRKATRTRRLAQAVEWLADGKPRNWKYMKRYR